MLVQKKENLLFNAQYYNQEKFLDITTKRKIDKHLSDINDTITEDDIRNVKTDIGLGASSFETTTVSAGKVFNLQLLSEIVK